MKKIARLVVTVSFLALAFGYLVHNLTRIDWDYGNEVVSFWFR